MNVDNVNLLNIDEYNVDEVIDMELDRCLMKKLILLLAVIYFTFSAFQNSVKADDKTTAVVGHVVSETIKNTDIDISYIMEKELEVCCSSICD